MRFETKDNLQLFDFQEVTVKEIKTLANDSIVFVLEALIAKGNNPNNEECVDRFLDIANMRFANGKIIDFFKEGYKYYDANGVLKEQIDDEKMELDDAYAILKQCKDIVLFDVILLSKTEEKSEYQIGIDLNDTDTYWMTISCKEVVVEWERFMNRVMR